VKSYSTLMIMGIGEAGKDVFSLPITAKSVVPDISLLTPLLHYGRCYLEYPSTREVELLNSSDLPVKYIVPPSVDESALVYSTPNPSGIICPHSTLNLPLEIMPKVQGDISVCVPISIANSTGPPLPVELSCIGEGPVVCVSPNTLKWGMCPVLTSTSKVVTLTNQSVIPAEFECALVSACLNTAPQQTLIGLKLFPP
jgi:hydrocephalus-inducing protein